jgi:hypothetical protein
MSDSMSGEVSIEVDVDGPVVSFAGTSLSASQKLFTFGGFVRRVSIRESTGTAPATVRFWDGGDVTGQLVDPITLVANESARDQYARGEYPIRVGLFMEVVTGEVDLSVTIQPGG